MTIIEQERKERLEEILRKIEFLLDDRAELLPSFIDHLAIAKCNVQDALTIFDNSEACNGQS